MAFRLAQKPTFKVRVTVPVPNDKGGHDNNTFEAVFKRTTHSELVDLASAGMTDAQIVRDRMTDWVLTDAESNQAVPFTTENLDALLEIQPAPKYIAKAFWEAAQGGKA